MNTNVLFVIVALLFFILTFVSHYYYREYSWWYSVESWVPWLQSFNNGFWKRFVQFIHFFGWELMWGVVAIFYSKFNRASSAFLIMTTCDTVFIVAILKMLWNDPATYMDREYIKAWACDQNTFQTPSLEVTISAFAYCMMFYLAYDWIDVIRDRVRKQFRDNAPNNEIVYEDQEEDFFLHKNGNYQTTKANDFSFWVWLTIIFFLNFLIAYASMYLGINSFDQVLYGMCIGYGLFCVLYFFSKDSTIERNIKVSEKMISTPDTIKSYIFGALFFAFCVAVIRVLYYFQMQDFTVNPTWKSEHFDECGTLPFPSFFDKELLFGYNAMYLNFGVFTGMTIDSLILGGTRVDYNQLRTKEDRNPTLGLIFRIVITVGWILLNVWGFTYLLSMIVHHWLFVMAIPYFVCGVGLFTFLKYIFQIVGATRPEIYPYQAMNAVERRAD